MKAKEQLTREELLALLWAIFIAEGDCRASVPFGWLRRKAEWKARQVSFSQILKEVASEIRREWEKFKKAAEEGKFPNDFVRWLARIGYNANPAEWVDWERNVKNALKRISSL